METPKLIGLSFQVEADALILPRITSYSLKRYQALMEKWLMDATGMSPEQVKDDKTMDSYLGPEWSYIRIERFIGKEGVDRKGVQYHSTPRQVLERIRFLGREIHSNFWINALFSQEQKDIWIITDVTYPNEADAVLERGGVLYRIDHNPAPMNYKPGHMARYPNFTDKFVTDGTYKSVGDIIMKILS